jgi:hypothetical protein
MLKIGHIPPDSFKIVVPSIVKSYITLLVDITSHNNRINISLPILKGRRHLGDRGCWFESLLGR